jgi:hypothetical protein
MVHHLGGSVDMMNSIRRPAGGFYFDTSIPQFTMIQRHSNAAAIGRQVVKVRIVPWK